MSENRSSKRLADVAAASGLIGLGGAASYGIGGRVVSGAKQTAREGMALRLPAQRVIRVEQADPQRRHTKSGGPDRRTAAGRREFAAEGDIKTANRLREAAKSRFKLGRRMMRGGAVAAGAGGLAALASATLSERFRDRKPTKASPVVRRVRQTQAADRDAQRMVDAQLREQTIREDPGAYLDADGQLPAKYRNEGRGTDERGRAL